MNDESRRSLSAMLTGGSFGLLTGLVLGLSLSPIVGQFIAPLFVIVTAILGLKEGIEEDAAFSLRKTVRAIGFALLCIVGIFFGMWIRINDVLAPDLNSQIKTLAALNLDKQVSDDIKESMARKAFLGSAILAEQENKSKTEPESKSEPDPAVTKSKTTLAATSNQTGLFAYTGVQLANLNPTRFHDSDAVTDLYKRTGGFWGALAESLHESDIRDDQRMKIYISFWNDIKNQ
ncbi:MAG: hypothetical protein JO076_00825 [Verrucomicrobia bacterium]|nr:hypothetical protein [Verrucomicrobiota bacterium]